MIQIQDHAVIQIIDHAVTQKQDHAVILAQELTAKVRGPRVLLARLLSLKRSCLENLHSGHQVISLKMFCDTLA